MIGELGRVADCCDGVRCDMAMLLLPDVIRRTWGDKSLPSDGRPPVDNPFWPEAIAQVHRRHPDLLFMAEVYWDLEWTLQQQGFDYTYDKRLYDRLRSRDVEGVRGHLHADMVFQRRCVRFLENHDEPRAASAFPSDVHRAAAILAFLTPGLRFFHDGQFEGRRDQGRDPAQAKATRAARPGASGFLSPFLGVFEASGGARRVVAVTRMPAGVGRQPDLGAFPLFLLGISRWSQAAGYCELWGHSGAVLMFGCRLPAWPGAGSFCTT